MDKFLKAIRKWALKVKNIPLLGALAEDLATLLDMLRDCSQGIYRKLPRGLMIATVIALVYALSPIDLLPDLIPLAGFLDDAEFWPSCWNSVWPGTCCATVPGGTPSVRRAWKP